MPEPPPTHPVDALVAAHARACLADLLAASDVPQTVTAVQQGKGWAVLVVAVPATLGESLPELTACDRDCLGLLAQAQEPLSAARVCRELDRRNLAIWAEITVKRSLAKLRRLGLPPPICTVLGAEEQTAWGF